MSSLIVQFQDLEDKFLSLERKMSDPEVISNQQQYQALVKEHSKLKEGVSLYSRYKKIAAELEDAKTLLLDPDMKEMAQAEVALLSEEFDRLTHELHLFLIPSDPDDDRDAMVEIRSGTGGEEAALFATVLFRMYSKYADAKGWKIEVLDRNLTELGGLKEISFSIKGSDVYAHMKFESGTHRVQRVPDTESSGRIHTSAATVAILPEAEEVDVHIDTKDLRIDTYRSSGAGGQHVNKTDSAVRITHEPSGIVVACQDERSQFQNKDKAMRMLRTKLYEKMVADQAQKEAAARKIQVGSGDRSQKIRTYNYPQGRVTDHRIGLTVHDLEGILSGELDKIVEPLIKQDQMDRLSSVS